MLVSYVQASPTSLGEYKSQRRVVPRPTFPRPRLSKQTGSICCCRFVVAYVRNYAFPTENFLDNRGTQWYPFSAQFPLTKLHYALISLEIFFFCKRFRARSNNTSCSSLDVTLQHVRIIYSSFFLRQSLNTLVESNYHIIKRTHQPA